MKMLRHHVDAWKFMGYCDRERDFAQRIALCKKKIARANSVPGRAEPRQLSKAPVDTPECVVWPLRPVKPFMRSPFSDLFECFATGGAKSGPQKAVVISWILLIWNFVFKHIILPQLA